MINQLFARMILTWKNRHAHVRAVARAAELTTGTRKTAPSPSMRRALAAGRAPLVDGGQPPVSTKKATNMRTSHRSTRCGFAAAAILTALAGTASADMVLGNGGTKYPNGKILLNPSIYLVYWGVGDPANGTFKDPSNVFPDTEKVIVELGGSAPLSVLTQYKVLVQSGGGIGTWQGFNNKPWTIAGRWYDTVNPIPQRCPLQSDGNGGYFYINCVTPPPNPTKPEVAQEAARAAVHFFNTQNVSDPDALFIILTGADRNTSATGGPPAGNQGAWHGGTQTNLPTSFGDRAFVDYPYSAGASLLQHEIAEAINDPLDGGGFSSNGAAGQEPCEGGQQQPPGEEIGDVCQCFRNNITLNTGFVQSLQPLYSNITHSCTNTAPSTYHVVADSGDVRLNPNDMGIDWAWGSFKAQCGPMEYVTGISLQVASGAGHSMLCEAAASSNLTITDQLNFDGANHEIDNTSGDWAYGSFKNQCARNDAVVAISQTPSGELSSIRCAAAPVDAAQCHGVSVGYVDNRETQANGDWAYGYYKTECLGYVKGMARDPVTHHPTALLCCSRVVIH